MQDYIEMINKLSVENEKKVFLLVMDGLGGLETTPGVGTELEAARTPNMDALAAEAACGLLDPIAPGFTPGSGPAHLSLFGYNPVKYAIGRGVLASAGIGFPMEKTDVAARGNFCTVDGGGIVTDRRAGRIPTSKNAELCEQLGSIEIDGVEVFVKPVMDYRCAVIFRGKGLDGRVKDTDPQQTGKPPLEAVAAAPEAELTAQLANKFVSIVAERLEGETPANYILMRGFDNVPDIPQFGDFTKMRAASIAVYPDYKGITRLIGMNVLEPGPSISDEAATLKECFDNHEYFYFHVKKTDSYGEDGNFDAKVHIIEETDAIIPTIMNLKPDVVAITGDHSTPALLKSHSWHPLPLLLWSNCCRPDGVRKFGEHACAAGGLGRMISTSLLPVMMANALKLLKFGA